MKVKNIIIAFTIFMNFFLKTIYAQNQAPVVQNVVFAQRTDESFMVDIYYDVNDVDGNTTTISVEVSDDNGSTWNFSCSNISGDVGAGITSGTNKHIVWDFAAEHPNTFGEQFRIKIIADDGVEGETVTDIDGNVYRTVKIGTQWWMAENLKVTHYRNGEAIPNVTDNSTWAGLTTGACCSYDNDSYNATTYGRLYNWYAVDDSRNIAPAGWHVPTDEEWKQLEMHLGMSQSEADNTGYRGTDEGSKLKNTSGWYAEGNGTNESGFSTLPGGARNDGNGHFYNMGSYAYFWSSTEQVSFYSWFRALDYIYSEVGRSIRPKRAGFSVRCIRNTDSQVTLTNIKISPTNKTLYNNEIQQFTCNATYSDGSTEDITSQATWTTSPGIAGSISSSGLFKAHSSNTGTETVKATYQGKQAQATVTVSTSGLETGTVTDIDGNVYQTVKIGDQWWMAENLKVTHYSNGDAIPNVTDNITWPGLTTGAYCNYDNDANNATTYGSLYNWYAVDDSRNIAPAGWHVPTDEEWQTLVDYLGGFVVAGGKMKETGTTHWQSPSTGTNESGFSALPGGIRAGTYGGSFQNLFRIADFGSTTEGSSGYTWDRRLGF